MTQVQVAEHRPLPQRTQAASKHLKVTGKLRTACDHLVYEGLAYDEAARKADLTVRAMRYALTRPHVIRYLREQREVLRASMCGANLLALADVRDQRDNQNARVAAVNALERMDEVAARPSSVGSTPGLTIQIITPQLSTPDQHLVVDASPTPDEVVKLLPSK